MIARPLEISFNDGDAEQYALGDHRAARQGLKRINGAQMAFAEKDAVPTELFGAHGALVDLVDILDATVKAVNAEFHAGLIGSFTTRAPRSHKLAPK
jgi:hypothetical protein